MFIKLASMAEPAFDPNVPGPPEVENMWLVRFANFISARRFVLALTLVGGFILSATVSTTLHAYRQDYSIIRESDFECFYSSNGTSQKSNFSSGGFHFDSAHLTVMTMIGGLLTAIGILWMAQRFSLRWAL